MPKKQKEIPLVHIVGTLNLQNSFLSDFIANEIGARTRTWSGIDLYLKHTPKGNPNLMMLDGYGLGVEQMKTALKSCKSAANPDYMALFNLPANRGIEKRVIPYGIHGVFYDGDPLAHFSKGVRAILSGELWMSRSVMADIIFQKGNPNPEKRAPHDSGLTTREIEILELITIGATNEAIARKLCISKNTVKTHIYNIFKKINVPNRLQAALWAVKNR